jgi:hypothetical protein
MSRLSWLWCGVRHDDNRQQIVEEAVDNLGEPAAAVQRRG